MHAKRVFYCLLRLLLVTGDREISLNCFQRNFISFVGRHIANFRSLCRLSWPSRFRQNLKRASAILHHARIAPALSLAADRPVFHPFEPLLGFSVSNVPSSNVDVTFLITSQQP